MIGVTQRTPLSAYPISSRSLVGLSGQYVTFWGFAVGLSEYSLRRSHGRIEVAEFDDKGLGPIYGGA